MASLYISEFERPRNQWVQNANAPPIAEQKLAIGAAVTSSAFQATTRQIRVHCDAICSIAFGPTSSVTATTSNMRLAANQTEYFSVNNNSFISVISNT